MTKDEIIKEYEKGNVVINTVEGLLIAKMDDFLNQPIEGILYDLNRDELTLLAFSDYDPTWVNSYAMTKAFRAVYNKACEAHP